MIWYTIVFAILSVYFAARFLLLSKGIKETSKDIRGINSNIRANTKLIVRYPNKNMEKLLEEINKYIEKTQVDKIKYIRREEEIRKEIENISHDLRTPLTSIRGYLELINDETTTEIEKQEYISVVEKKAKSLQQLIDIFYDLSRLEGNNYKMNIEVIDINKELREQLLLFYNDFEKSSINVDLNLCEKKTNVNLDRVSIDRVFANLIQNAIRYAKDSVKVISTINEQYIIITFSNNIQYMKKEEVDLLFNRFYMGDASRNNSGSSGLGLTITKLLVEKMGGEIKAESTDEWISFQIKFPLL